jgi:quercetin dioxygenase-like cupin family protein
MSDLVLGCDDLDAAMAVFVGELGFRLLEITPADDPRAAVLESRGVRLRLERRGPRRTPDGGWVQGRAGMAYRDLVPDRLGGRLIASHIRIAEGGPVPDYVHHHQVDFQLIYCVRGWVEVVYQDQGPALVLGPGDAALQPPTIRHRVLSASAGLEVIEVASPAEHSTFVDHELTLPTPMVDREREFGGQRFVHNVAAEAVHRSWHLDGFQARDLELETATGGRATARAIRALGQPSAGALPDSDRIRFLAVLAGSVAIPGSGTLEAGAAATAGAGEAIELARPSADLELLELELTA